MDLSVDIVVTAITVILSDMESGDAVHAKNLSQLQLTPYSIN